MRADTPESFVEVSMTLDEIRKELDAIVDVLVQWIQYIRDPRGRAVKLLGVQEEEQSRIKRALGIWVVSFVISLLVLTPVYSSVGIGFKNVEFQLAIFLFLTSALICAGACAHIGFRWYGLRSNFGDTLLVYTVFFGSYSPIFNFIAYPYSYVLFRALRQAKSGQLGIYDAAVTGFTSLQSGAMVTFVGPVANLFTTVATFLLLGMFASTLADYYRTTRKQILISLSFSFTVLAMIPTLLMTFLYYFVVYTYSS
jgi:hypothetical protein